MDGAEVAVNYRFSARSCPRCWCPDSELADGHRGECHYRRMAEVMEQLDAARPGDELLDDNDQLVGGVKDIKEVEKRLETQAAEAAAAPAQRMAFCAFQVLRAVYFCPQGRTASMVSTLCPCMYTGMYTGMYLYM